MFNNKNNREIVFSFCDECGTKKQIFFTEFKTYHLLLSSSGDRLEKLDQVEGLIRDTIENWNSFQEAYKDIYPSEGYLINRLFSTN